MKKSDNVNDFDRRHGGRSAPPPPMNNLPDPNSRELNFCQQTQKSKPQANSVALELMCLFSGGMILGNVLYSVRNFNEPWTSKKLFEPTSHGYMMFSLSSFLFAAALGGLSYHYMMQFIPRKILRQIPSILLCISGILYVATPSIGSTVIISRVFAGFATAMSLVFLLIKAPEVCLNQVRGINTSIAASLFSGMGVMIAGSLQETDFVSAQERIKDSELWMNSLRWYGFMILFFVGMGQLINCFLNYESPVYFLEQGDVPAARKEMCRLRNETNETWEIRKDLEELQNLVTEDRNLSANVFKDGNLRALLLVLLVRLTFVFSFNYPTNIWRIRIVNNKFYTFDETKFSFYFFGAMILGACRMSSLFGIFLFDTVGRKKIFMVSSIGTVISGIIIASVFSNANENMTEPMFNAVVAFAIIYEIFQALAIAETADIFSAEAFALPKKAASIGFAVAVEYLAQAIILLGTFEWLHKIHDPREPRTYWGEFNLFLIFAVLLIASTVLIWLKVPETKKLSIRDTRSKFRGFNTHIVSSAYA